MPEISVVMQTKILREHGEEKLIRAVNSVLGQKPKCSYELIIVCDGCQKSFDTISTYFAEEFRSVNPKIRLFMLDEQTKPRNNHWRSSARNVGLEYATGFWVVYIDNDDYFINNYLKQLCSLDPVNDWYLANDLIWSNNCWRVRIGDVRMGHCGTSNVIHKRSMLSRWPEVASYGKEDWRFINNLVAESKNYKSLDVAGYCCCHIPNKYDV